MIEDALKRITDKINDQKQVEEQALLKGNVTDFSNYRYRTGVLAGIEVALNKIEDYRQELKKHGERFDT